MKYGYFHGRFQPFHNGHLSVAKFIYDQCDFLVIGISYPFRDAVHSLDPDASLEFAKYLKKKEVNRIQDNPWPYWVRLLMVREACIHAGLDIRKIIILPELMYTGKSVDEFRFPKDKTTVFIFSKDLHHEYAIEKYNREGWQVRRIGLIDFPNCSGTSIRDLIRQNNPLWESMVPKGTSDVIKETLALSNITMKRR